MKRFRIAFAVRDLDASIADFSGRIAAICGVPAGA
jgi:hypothetical protein